MNQNQISASLWVDEETLYLKVEKCEANLGSIRERLKNLQQPLVYFWAQSYRLLNEKSGVDMVKMSKDYLSISHSHEGLKEISPECERIARETILLAEVPTVKYYESGKFAPRPAFVNVENTRSP